MSGKCDVYAQCYECWWDKKIYDNIDDSELPAEYKIEFCERCGEKISYILTHPGQIPPRRLPIEKFSVPVPKNGETIKITLV